VIFITKEKALEYVKRKNIQPKSPKMNMLRRKPRMDRKKTTGDLLTYLDWIAEHSHILTPNLVCYANPEVHNAFIRGFIDDNLKMRSKVKKDGFAAGQRGDKAYAAFCDLLQANYKIRNNSISGATSSPHNPLYYASAHTSLTSTCRAITTTANSINEKMMASNRHYFNPLVTMENLVYIVRTADLALIDAVMLKYGLKFPTVDQAFELVLKCTRKYWESPDKEAVIYEYLSKVSPIALAAIMFCGDIKALTEVNSNFMKGFYADLMQDPAVEITSAEEAKTIIKEADEDVKFLATYLYPTEMKGVSTRDVHKDNPPLACKLAGKIHDLYTKFHDYSDFIKAFITTTIMPSHLHSFPSMLRDSVVASDTDSSIFSMQHQVRWYCDDKKDYQADKGIRVACLTSYFASQNIAHNLGNLCAQIGVESKYLFRCTMKNEFYFPVMVVTTRTKHYMALMSACEGNVYEEVDAEIKGVNLKNSKLPPLIRRNLLNYQEGLMKMVAAGEQLTPMNVIGPLAYIEHLVLEDIRSGGATFYRYEKAKTRETYANPESSNYEKIVLWNDVFGPKYGVAEQLPVDCVKIPVDLPKMADIEEYASTLDEVAGKSLIRHVQNWKKNPKYTNLIVPVEMLQDNKIPKELLPILDERKILRTIMDAFYITAECYSMYCMNRHNTRFYSDLYTKEEAAKGLFFDIEETKEEA
jgi:hypothetical protein